MKKTFLFLVFFTIIMVGKSFALDVGKEYFVKTALHAVRGDEIYWVNYTDKCILIPAGEKVKITYVRDHIIKFDLNGKTYNFAFTEKGNAGSDEIYSKFFTAEDVNVKIEKYPEDIKSKAKRGIAEKGMTKEQILSAVGVPAIIDGQNKTFNLTLKEIMASDKWIFYFNRFNRWQVEFIDNKVSDIKN